MSLKYCDNKNKGFTLIEAIVAIIILVVGVIASFILITSTLSASSLSSQRLIAAYLGQEGIEIVRNIRDTNWLQEAPHVWDEQLVSNCGGICDGVTNGCRVDYYSPTQEDPVLQAYDNTEFLKIDSDGYSYSGSTPTRFRRQVVINPNGTHILNVCVRVEWREKGRTYNVIVRENLYDWLKSP